MDKPTSLQPELYAIGLSAYIGVTGVPGQVTAYIDQVSGGTLFISAGPSALVNGIGQTTGFWIDPSLPQFNTMCAGTFFLTAVGTTAIVQVLKVIAGTFP